MWVSQYLTSHSFQDAKTSVGEVSASSQEKSDVNSSNEYFQIRRLSPYGVSSVPADGSDSVIVHTARGDFLLSVMDPGVSLEPGEVALHSMGGASIVLKNDGRVLINGRTVE